MSLPGGVLNNPRWQARDDDDLPMAFAKLYSYEVGGAFSTPQFLYADSLLTTPLTNPVLADAGGFFPEMFMLHVGYDLRLKTTLDVTVRSALDVEDIGASFLGNLGLFLSDGARDVASGYTVLATDLLITTDSTDATDPFVLNLGLVANRTYPLCIKHQSAFDCEVTPDGTNSIDGLAVGTVYTIPAAASPNFPSIWLVPDDDGVTYRIVASHGL